MRLESVKEAGHFRRIVVFNAPFFNRFALVRGDEHRFERTFHVSAGDRHDAVWRQEPEEGEGRWREGVEDKAVAYTQSKQK